MNMGNHHMSCRDMANPEDGKKKTHDMSVIKGFIRWVRVWIYKKALWRDSIARLRQVWATTSA